jgi:cytidine deaminase
MAGMLPNIFLDRRAALATLGSAGLGLLAMHLTPAHGREPQGEPLARILPKFKEASCGRLLRLLREPGFSGQIPASDVKGLLETEGKRIDNLMLELLPLARTYSRPPISNYLVGVVARGLSGALYLGANLEIPGHSLGFSVHGEQSAISNAYMHADGGISAIAVTAAPCGHCRQFMNELSPGGDIQILVQGSPATNLSTLLPSAFGPKDLGARDGAFPVKEVDLNLPKGMSDELAVAALDAARKSYAPYTKAHSGVAIGTGSGRIYKGSYIENAAFNPSLSPLQTALVALIAAGENHAAISRATLVEIDGAAISQRSVVDAVLRAIAPAARLQVVTVTKTG